MRILGIDYGDRHLGLALSDALRITAQPLGTYRMSDDEEENRRYFRELVATHTVDEIVIGDPLRLDGSRGTRAQKTREFAAWLGKAVDRPIFFMDERLTTREALAVLNSGNVRGKRRKEKEDQISAVIILSTYLERRQRETHGSQVG